MGELKTNVGPDDHILGPKDAPIHLVEYGDYQCTFCAAAHRDVSRLERRLRGTIAFVFRHFPLTRVHAYALLAAEAAECAAGQGRFWQLHDLLLENQHSLDLPSLLSYAQMLDLNVGQFAADMKSHRFLGRIRRDFMDGVRSGVNGTPTFFINGRRHDGACSLPGLREAIEGGAPAYHY